MAFAVPFLCYFQELQLLVVRTFWTNFSYIVLLYLWRQKVCLRFLKSYFKRHTRKVRPGTRDTGPGTHTCDPEPGPSTWDPEPATFTWHPGPGTLHLGLFTWEPGSGTWDPRPYMRDPIWNRDQILLRGTRDPYINTNLGTPTLTTSSIA